jgi:intracellular sulfur oxidation DsrE/DsrF family protein
MLAALIALPLTAMTAKAQAQPDGKAYKVVFEVSLDGAEKWLGALRNADNVQKALGVKTTKIVVIAHGKGIGMLLDKTADANPEIQAILRKLHGDGVIFAGCENTMRRLALAKKDLIEQATTVDSGVAEVIRKQGAGWAYIKAGS